MRFTKELSEVLKQLNPLFEDIKKEKDAVRREQMMAELRQSLQALQ